MLTYKSGFFCDSKIISVAFVLYKVYNYVINETRGKGSWNMENNDLGSQTTGREKVLEKGKTAFQNSKEVLYKLILLIFGIVIITVLNNKGVLSLEPIFMMFLNVILWLSILSIIIVVVKMIGFDLRL